MTENDADPSLPYFDLLAGGVLFLLLLISRYFFGGLEISALRVMALFLLFSALIFIFLPFSQLRKFGLSQEGQSYINTTQVADKGLYALVRHPQYLGYMLLTSGFVLLSLHWIKIILGFLALFFFFKQIKKEDAYCLQAFGQPYQEYCQKVPAINIFLGLWQKMSKSGEN